jgi:3-keto-5-aminohexanoate cleavage enzyme
MMKGTTLGNRYIINFTPTGMIPTREMTSHVPLTVDEIVEDVLKVTKIGVSMVHLHARDPVTEEPTYKKDVYGEIIRGIRKHHKDLILGVSTSGRNFKSFSERSECLELEGELKPDFASLTLSSVNFNKQASINSPDMIKSLARKMMERNIKPELEAFDLGMINYAKYLIRKKLLRPPYYFNLILGNIACAQADMLHLGLMIRELPENSYWSVGGIGEWQLKMNILSIVSGGGVRIGLEDNIWFDNDRKKPATNYELVERVVEIAKSMSLLPYRPAEVRRLLISENGGVSA